MHDDVLSINFFCLQFTVVFSLNEGKCCFKVISVQIAEVLTPFDAGFRHLAQKLNYVLI
jgi:hypothetical protein